MFDLEGAEKLAYLKGYISGLTEREYKNFIREAERVSKGNQNFIDILKNAKAQGVSGNGIYPNFSEYEIKCISILYDECRSGHIMNNPEIDINKEGIFTNIILNMSDEEYEKFIAECTDPKSPSNWISMNIEKIRNSEAIIKAGNWVDRIYFSQDDEERYQKLIDDTIARYKAKIKGIEVHGESKKGGTEMAEEKVNTQEEKLVNGSNLTKEQWASNSIGVTEPAFSSFVEYIKSLQVKELYDFMEENNLDQDDYVWKILYSLNETKEFSEDRIDNLYPPERKNFAKIINQFYKEHLLVNNIHEQIERSFENTETEKKAYNQFKKEEVLRSKLIDKMAQQLGMNSEDLKPYIRTDIENQELLIACVHIKDLVKEHGPEGTLEKLKGAYAEKNPDKQDNPFEVKLGTETKKTLVDKIKETRKKGKEIAEDKVEKRKQEIKEIAAKYREEMGNHVSKNIEVAESKINKLKSQQEQLLANRDGIMAELEKATKELEKLQKEYEKKATGIQEKIDLHDEKISSLEKNSKALIKRERKDERRSRFGRFISKLVEKLGAYNKRLSKKERDAILEGKSEVQEGKGVGFFETVGEAIKETRKESKEYIDSQKRNDEEKIKKVIEKKEKLEAKLAEAQEELNAKEIEVIKARDMQEHRDDEILSQVKDAEMLIDGWAEDIKHLEKLQQRIANLSDRKAYRLSKKGIDKEGMDR